MKEYCESVDFYINESYGGIPADLLQQQQHGITDEQLKEHGSPPVPDEVLRSHRFQDMTRSLKEITLNLNKKCKAIIAELYGKQVTRLQGESIVKYAPGQSLPYHQDWSISEYVIKNGFPVVHLSSVFYINDDYEGGELIFSTQKQTAYQHDVMSLKPQAGTIIFFDALHWHASAPVKSGHKFAITNFYTL
jgi:predicted 2-oxoglutarate/Fe(II)-dependent dioxygenase YbiX